MPDSPTAEGPREERRPPRPFSIVQHATPRQTAFIRTLAVRKLGALREEQAIVDAVNDKFGFALTAPLDAERSGLSMVRANTVIEVLKVLPDSGREPWEGGPAPAPLTAGESAQHVARTLVTLRPYLAAAQRGASAGPRPGANPSAYPQGVAMAYASAAARELAALERTIEGLTQALFALDPIGRPVPEGYCAAVVREDGEPCTGPAVEGTSRCVTHLAAALVERAPDLLAPPESPASTDRS